MPVGRIRPIHPPQTRPLLPLSIMSRSRPVLVPLLVATLALGACSPGPMATMSSTPTTTAATSTEESEPPQITRPDELSRETASSTSSEASTESTSAGDCPTWPVCDGGVGAAGIGDPYYPMSGNGGYQVEHYDVTITYDPATNDLQGDTVVRAVIADAALSRFNLDLQPSMVVETVEVDGAAATFEQESSELVITPAEPVQPAATVEVRVTYAGEPNALPDGTAGLGDGGWHRTNSGGALALGEPYSASAWFPVNEHPADPATYDITAVVPQEWQVISIGLEADAETEPPAGWIASRWQQSKPVASYLTTLWIDKFTTSEGVTAAGVPILNAFAEVPTAPSFRVLAEKTGPAIDQLTQWFGPYPYDAAGGIFTGESTSFALETATRPVYADWVDLETLVHEIAHQWWGDDVMIATWSDICLNECFASYTPWLYYDATAGVDPDLEWKSQMKTLVQQPRFWASPLVDMGAGNEFSAVYSRGPLALHALRHQIGDEDFFAMMKGWLAENSGKNVTFDQWVEYTEEISGQDLTGFIDAWFRGTTVPAEQYRYPGTLGD